MKMQLECMVKHLDKCPVEVKEAEKMLKSSIEISIQGDNAWSSYDDMKIFMNEKCQKMPTGKCTFVHRAADSNRICELAEI